MNKIIRVTSCLTCSNRQAGKCWEWIGLTEPHRGKILLDQTIYEGCPLDNEPQIKEPNAWNDTRIPKPEVKFVCPNCGLNPEWLYRTYEGHFCNHCYPKDPKPIIT